MGGVVQRSLVTGDAERIMAVFTAAPRVELSGPDLCREAGITVGAHPAQAGLEREGWLMSRWEEAGQDRPRRRLYRRAGPVTS